MMNFLRSLFSTDFMAHGYCLRLPGVIRLHEISDLIIGLSYFLIPIALIYLVRIRRDLAWPWMFGLFGLFILSCGSTHLLAVYVLWHPIYRFEGVVKALTAALSFPTALLLIRLVPRVRLLPSPELLRQQNALLATEVAERKVAEAEVRRLNEELERRVADRTRELQQANEDLRQFTWAASHDLQEPLRMVTIFSEMTEQTEWERLTEDGKFYLRTAADGARKMQGLLTDLLSYTQLASAAPEGNPKCSAQQAFDEALTNLGLAAAECSAEIYRATPLPEVTITHSQLVQVFQNLLSNALKYRRPDAIPLVGIRAERHPGQWLFSVSDNGIGIDPPHHKRIFEAFKRLSNNDIPGSGLGLALCQRLIERNGGRIWVDSEGAGRGSTFFFTLTATD